MDEALLEWAGEAMLARCRRLLDRPLELLLYDHPARGWLWIPHDLDAAINWTDPRIDPIYYWGGDTPAGRRRGSTISAVIGDDAWRERYVAALRRAHEVYAAAQLPELLDRFAAQIRDAAAADPTRPFTFDEHLREVAYLRQSFTTRSDSCAPGWTAGVRPTARPTPTATGGPSAWTARTTTRRHIRERSRSAATGAIRTATASTRPATSQPATAPPG